MHSKNAAGNDRAAIYTVDRYAEHPRLGFRRPNPVDESVFHFNILLNNPDADHRRWWEVEEEALSWFDGRIWQLPADIIDLGIDSRNQGYWKTDDAARDLLRARFTLLRYDYKGGKKYYTVKAPARWYRRYYWSSDGDEFVIYLHPPRTQWDWQPRFSVAYERFSKKRTLHAMVPGDELSFFNAPSETSPWKPWASKI